MKNEFGNEFYANDDDGFGIDFPCPHCEKDSLIEQAQIYSVKCVNCGAVWETRSSLKIDRQFKDSWVFKGIER